MNEVALSSLLKRGTKTWHGGGQSGDCESTIDLVLTSETLGVGMEIVQQRAVTYGRSTALYQQPTRGGYRSLPRNRAYLLTQLRTGHNWLPTYAKSFGFRDDDHCVCGAQETFTHVLVDCPSLRDIRRELRREVGDAFRSVSSLLGGSPEGKKGTSDTVSRAKTVKAVLEFAEASHRFWSRAPRGQPNNGNGI